MATATIHVGWNSCYNVVNSLNNSQEVVFACRIPYTTLTGRLWRCKRGRFAAIAASALPTSQPAMARLQWPAGVTVWRRAGWPFNVLFCRRPQHKRSILTSRVVCLYVYYSVLLSDRPHTMVMLLSASGAKPVCVATDAGLYNRGQ